MKAKVFITIMVSAALAFLMLGFIGCGESRSQAGNQCVSFTVGEGWSVAYEGEGSYSDISPVAGETIKTAYDSCLVRAIVYKENPRTGLNMQIRIAYPAPQKTVDTLERDAERKEVNGIQVRTFDYAPMGISGGGYYIYFLDPKMPVEIEAESVEAAIEEADKIVESLKVNNAYE